MSEDDFGDFSDFSSAFPSVDAEISQATQQGLSDCDFTVSDLNFDLSLRSTVPTDGTVLEIPHLCGGIDLDISRVGRTLTSATQAPSNNTSTTCEHSPINVDDCKSESEPTENCSSAVAQHLYSTSTQVGTAHQQDEEWDDFGGFETAIGHSLSNNFGNIAAERNQHCVTTGALSNQVQIFLACFESTTESNVMIDSTSTNIDARFSWLSRLQKSIDFTVPLYKWDASYLHAGYYTSIKVDPVLVTKTDVASVNDNILPLVKGQSAALDLMESFGFEGGVEPTSPNEHNQTYFSDATTQFHQSHTGPTLLDLSLPNSPLEDLQNDLYSLAADLQDLDLHSTKEKRERTSIEELVLNEKLVINRTTWMDSELEQLGNDMAVSPLVSYKEQSQKLSKKGTFQEQLKQLGLDTTKTTLAMTTLPAVSEMSISARLVFDRLPNLSFMLKDSLVNIDHAYYIKE